MGFILTRRIAVRKKTTVNNYGKYNEAIFVCNDRYLDFCNNLSKALRDTYGIKAEAVTYTQITQPTKTLLHKLKTTYRVIFMLSNGVVEESLQTEDHPFLKMYAYVHQHNPLAIACVTLDHYVVKDGLSYPDFMSDFDYMHRKRFYTWSVEAVAADLAKEIRRYYPRDCKVDLSIKHVCDYWVHRCYYEKCTAPGIIKYLGLLSGGLLLVIWALFLISDMDFVSAFIFYDVFCGILFFVCYARRFSIGIARKNAGLEHMYKALKYTEYDALPNGEVPRKVRTMRDRMASNKQKNALKMLCAFVGWLIFICLEVNPSNSYQNQLVFAFLKWIYVAWLFTGFVTAHLECLWGEKRLSQIQYCKALDVYDSMHEIHVKLFCIRIAMMLIAGVVGILLFAVMPPMK